MRSRSYPCTYTSSYLKICLSNVNDLYLQITEQKKTSCFDPYQRVWSTNRYDAGPGWNQPSYCAILMKLGVSYQVDHTLLHSEFRGSRTIFNFRFSWGPPFGFLPEFFDGISVKNPKGGPQEYLEVNVVPDPRNLLCINLW